jgi:hypothetical protein
MSPPTYSNATTPSPKIVNPSQSYGGHHFPPPALSSLTQPHGSPPGQSRVTSVQTNTPRPPYSQPENRGRQGYPPTSLHGNANLPYPDFEHSGRQPQLHTHSQTSGAAALAGSPTPRCCYPNCGAPVARTMNGELTEYCGEEHMLCVLALQALTDRMVLNSLWVP